MIIEEITELSLPTIQGFIDNDKVILSGEMTI